MQVIKTDVAIISRVYPIRSHTAAAEGGAAGVAQDHNSLDNHFNDTVSGGDWLCDQDVVEYFVENAASVFIGQAYDLHHPEILVYDFVKDGMEPRIMIQ